MSIEIPARLKDALSRRMVIPFVGSGVSQKSAASKFPSWTGLLNLLLETSFSSKRITKQQSRQISALISDGKLLMAAEILKREMPPDEYIATMREAFTYSDADRVNLTTQSLILDLNSKVIITTNYDRLLEDAYSKKFGRVPSVSSYNDTSNLLATLQDTSLSQSPVIFKIHGDVGNINSLILSDRDYRRIVYDEAMYENIMTSIFMHNVIIFIGFSMSDREVMMHVERLRHRMNYESAPHYALLQKGSVSVTEASALRRDVGIEIIEYPSSKSHSAIDRVLAEMIKFADES